MHNTSHTKYDSLTSPMQSNASEMTQPFDMCKQQYKRLLHCQCKNYFSNKYYWVYYVYYDMPVHQPSCPCPMPLTLIPTVQAGEAHFFSLLLHCKCPTPHHPPFWQYLPTPCPPLHSHEYGPPPPLWCHSHPWPKNFSSSFLSMCKAPVSLAWPYPQCCLLALYPPSHLLALLAVVLPYPGLILSG